MKQTFSPTKFSWQYTGTSPFDEIVYWCTQTFEVNKWYWAWETIYFSDKKDYVWFMLRWS